MQVQSEVVPSSSSNLIAPGALQASGVWANRAAAPFHSAFEYAPWGVALVDSSGRCLDANPALCELTGYDRHELLGDGFEAFVVSADRATARELLQLQAGEIDHYQKATQLGHKQGHTVDVVLVASVARDEANRPAFCTVQIQKAPSQTGSLARRSEDEARFRELADTAPVFIGVAGPDRACEYVSKTWLEYLGARMSDLQGEGWSAFLHEDDRDSVVATYHAAFDARQSFEIEYRMRRRDGEYRWMFTTAVPRFTPTGELTGYVFSAVDITDRKQAQFKLQQLLADSEQAQARLVEQAERLHQLAESDPLTGVLNRRSFHEHLDREWSRSIRHERPLSCIMLDIDFFKKINDTHGHAAGDAILKRMAEVLLFECRPSDRVCRYGGEEFCIMAPETDETGAAALAERLRTAIALNPIPLGNKSVTITSSFGVAEQTVETDGAEEMIERADQALHIAKHSGRNRVVRFASENVFADLMTYDSPARILADLKAGDLVTPTPYIHRDETIGHTIELFFRHNIGSAPVIDDAGKLVGFISERDLMLLNVSREAWSRPVREVMKTNVVCYEESTPGTTVFQFLCRVSIHRIVVVKNGRPIGIISPSSLLKRFQERIAREGATAAASA